MKLDLEIGVTSKAEGVALVVIAVIFIIYNLVSQFGAVGLEWFGRYYGL